MQMVPKLAIVLEWPQQWLLSSLLPRHLCWGPLVASQSLAAFELLKLIAEHVFACVLQGWTSVDLSKPGDPYPIILRYRDPIEALKDLLSDPRNAAGFIYHPDTVVNENGERVVSSPETAEWMQKAQVGEDKRLFSWLTNWLT